MGPNDPNSIVVCSAHSTCSTAHAIVTTLLVFFVLLTGFAYTTVLERRFISFMQSRIGPNRAGPKGLLQPVSEGIKLIFKEEIIPDGADKVVYSFAPLLKLVPSLIVLAVVPLGPHLYIPWFDDKWYEIAQGFTDVNVGVLWILAVTSISVYGITLAGWASNNKYALLGALRASASMISYELSLGTVFAVPIMLAGSMSIGDIIDKQSGLFVNWYIFQNPLAAIIMFIALMAEISRAPFDMPEAEQELVAGHITEYSGMKFALFFLAEYVNMIGISVIFITMFMGGYEDGFGLVKGAPLLALPILIGKVIPLLIIMVWIRGTIFRPRYDRLMAFGWKVMLPLSLLAVMWTAVSIVIEQEGGSIAYLISVAVLFLIVAALGYAFNRGTAPESVIELDDFEREKVGLGYIVLQFVGGLLSVPFVAYEAFKHLRPGGSEKEAKAKS
ncbi:MAG: NADH-quinone oxidoreductase subunit NuoH [Chloroflexi bacterium]|nr:NADH-quinone oxidoreductase subunit NuoH [Chloroflexota bacterium]